MKKALSVLSSAGTLFLLATIIALGALLGGCGDDASEGGITLAPEQEDVSPEGPEVGIHKITRYTLENGKMEEYEFFYLSLSAPAGEHLPVLLRTGKKEEDFEYFFVLIPSGMKESREFDLVEEVVLVPAWERHRVTLPIRTMGGEEVGESYDFRRTPYTIPTEEDGAKVAPK